MTLCLLGEHLDLWRGEHPVLKAVSVAARSGELLVLTGPNGSGKTTLLRTLCGLLQPEQGRVLWQGKNIREDLPAYHAQLAYLGHEPPLKADLSAAENLRFWIGIRRPVSRIEIATALRRVGSDAWADRPVRTLSAGQKRRAALAGVILCAAPLWLLDEPATNLDADGQGAVASLIEEHVASGGMVVAAVHQGLPVSRIVARQLELPGA
jgi:heme exporter protein A